MQLLEKSIEVKSIHFFIGFGISNNRFKRFDLTEPSINSWELPDQS